MVAEYEDPSSLSPQIQPNNYQIILNTSEIDLQTGRKNSITKGREQATLKADMWFGKDTDLGCCVEEGEAGTEKGKIHINTKGSTKRK